MEEKNVSKKILKITQPYNKNIEIYAHFYRFFIKDFFVCENMLNNNA